MGKAIKFRNKNNEEIYPCPYFPVGSIFISTSSEDPTKYFGGTWEQFAKGKTLIGVDTNDSSFNTVNKTGGNKSHNHGYRVGYYPYYGGLIGADNVGIVAYDYESSSWKNGSSDSGMPSSGKGNTGLTASNKDLSSAKYSVYATTTNKEALPPYVTVYIWRRTK